MTGSRKGQLDPDDPTEASDTTALDADALRDIAALLVQMADRFEARWTPQEKDKLVTYGLRLRASTFAAIEERAKTEKIPSERVICRALAQAGLRVAPGDLDTTLYRRIV